MTTLPDNSSALGDVLYAFSTSQPTVDNNTLSATQIPELAASCSSIIGLSILFCAIVVTGIVGNCLVVVVVLTDVKMRQSVTNLLIINLALADLVIMVLGLPEMVMFVMRMGWQLGSVACRTNRFMLVTSLYCSVISLVVLCVERFIGIVFPLKVSELCTKGTTLVTIFLIWTVSALCGLPVVLFNQTVETTHGIHQCQIVFPGPHMGRSSYMTYKFIESAIFYYFPMAVQVVLYSIIAKRLHASSNELCYKLQVRATSRPGLRLDLSSNTIKARRGVVKMLVSSVILYFISYSPLQVHLIYSSFAHSSFLDSWEFFVFVIVFTHINSAANPVLYAIFSHNFRRNFRRCLCSYCARYWNTRARFHSRDSRNTRMSTRSLTTSRTCTSRM